ncbi:MAG: Phosphate:acyl-ACP acyltransferase PlsX [Ktedonobacterales bacterium]|jgi:glycerol-3-phosphate acyltransferase PlsX|nr:MAG: Phosphate:acyl-ACP acyltransferase PlsX [Ktedonobacterales bacterium]
MAEAVEQPERQGGATARMRIALDAMGGDYAPEEVVLGAVQAAREQHVGVLLVGPEDAIRPQLAKYDIAGLDLEVVHADEVIGMDEHPAEAVRAKKRNSITLAHELVRDGRAVAAVSAGNSGAVLAAAIFTLRRIRGIERPAFGGVVPAAGGRQTLIIDMGANTDCKPSYLLQFAYMGHAYMRSVFGVERPRVGLLSNGEEESKGDQLTQQAHQLIKDAAPGLDLNFIGNVEGRNLNDGSVDVVVCDGFVGNVALKLSEGLAKMLLATIKEELMSQTVTKVGALLAKPAFDRVRTKLDYEEYGGVPVLGVNGISIISHGRSKAKAIKNAIRVARQAAEARLPEVIAQGVKGLEAKAALPTTSGE